MTVKKTALLFCASVLTATSATAADRASMVEQTTYNEMGDVYSECAAVYRIVEVCSNNLKDQTLAASSRTWQTNAENYASAAYKIAKVPRGAQEVKVKYIIADVLQVMGQDDPGKIECGGIMALYPKMKQCKKHLNSPEELIVRLYEKNDARIK